MLILRESGPDLRRAMVILVQSAATDTVLDIAVSQLKDVIIVMQSEFIAILQASIRLESRGLFRNFRIRTANPRLLAISDTARPDSISALAALAQRLAPVPRSISAPAANNPATNRPTSVRTLRPASFFCEGARHLQANRYSSEENISTLQPSHCGQLWPEGTCALPYRE